MQQARLAHRKQRRARAELISRAWDLGPEQTRTELDTLACVISVNLTRAALEAAPVVADLQLARPISPASRFGDRAGSGLGLKPAEPAHIGDQIGQPGGCPTMRPSPQQHGVENHVRPLICQCLSCTIGHPIVIHDRDNPTNTCFPVGPGERLAVACSLGTPIETSRRALSPRS